MGGSQVVATRKQRQETRGAVAGYLAHHTSNVNPMYGCETANKATGDVGAAVRRVHQFHAYDRNTIGTLAALVRFTALVFTLSKICWLGSVYFGSCFVRWGSFSGASNVGFSTTKIRPCAGI